MRLSNRNKTPLFGLLNSLVAVCIVACIGAYVFDLKAHFLHSGSFFLLLIPILVGMFYFLAGRQIFEYDSDGEALNFKNRSIIPGLYKTASDEFPKYKVKNFQMLDLPFYKKLYIRISSKKSSVLTLKYDITYLTKKERRDLRISLNKVVAANTELKPTNNQ